RGDELRDERHVALRIDAEPRATVKLAHEPGEPRDAMRVRIADLDVVARKAEQRDRLAGRGARAFSQQNAHWRIVSDGSRLCDLARALPDPYRTHVPPD